MQSLALQCDLSDEFYINSYINQQWYLRSLFSFHFGQQGCSAVFLWELCNVEKLTFSSFFFFVLGWGVFSESTLPLSCVLLPQVYEQCLQSNLYSIFSRRTFPLLLYVCSNIILWFFATGWILINQIFNPFPTDVRVLLCFHSTVTLL